MRLIISAFYGTIFRSPCTLAIAQKLTVGNADLAGGELFSLTPGDVFGNAAAFLLSETEHDDEQFAFGIQGHDFSRLKETFTVHFLQPADGGQAVHGVSCKTPDALGDNLFSFPRQHIPDHAVKAHPAIGVNDADRLDDNRLYAVPFPGGHSTKYCGTCRSRIVWIFCPLPVRWVFRTTGTLLKNIFRRVAVHI